MNLATSILPVQDGGLTGSTGGNGAADAGKVWLVLSLQTTDSPARTITLLAGIVEIVQDGYNSAGTAPTVDNSAFTKAEADARFLRNLSAITALTGGGATALDGIATADGAFPTNGIVWVHVADELQGWVLLAGTDAEDAPGGIVRPDDYDGSTNARIWTRRA